jgi:hypothetical protein
MAKSRQSVSKATKKSKLGAASKAGTKVVATKKASSKGAVKGSASAKKPAPLKGNFDSVKAAIKKYGDKLRSYEGVVDVRPGYKFTDGWITSTPAIVVYVKQKIDRDKLPKDKLIPRTVGGVKVDVTPVKPDRTKVQTTRGLSMAGAVDINNGGDDLALPGWEEDEEGISRGLSFAAAPAERQAYQPPPDVKLTEVKDAMKVTCHVSPDKGWEVLGGFLASTKRSLTLGMYDFTAPHIKETLQETMSQKNRRPRLILDPGMSITGKTKAKDIPEDIIKDDFGKALGKRFEFVWAPVGRRKVTTSIFPTAYHIKVAVRDNKAFWLSSGNMQSSNQPDRDSLKLPIAKLLHQYNREWNVVVEHTGLAKTYEEFLKWDIKKATPLQAKPSATPLDFAGAEDSVALLIPEEMLAAAAAIPEPDYEASVEFVFTANKPLRVRPLLTPDNYAENALKVIRAARQKLYFQNQYIKVGKKMGKKFKALLDALFSKINEGVEVRIILRDLPKLREVLEALQFYAAENHNIDDISPFIKIQPGCHTKGIIADSKIVMVGSHNYSDQGVTDNRDASLIFFDKQIAGFYEQVFLYDWKHLARKKLITEHAVAVTSGGGGLAIAGNGDEGLVPVPWDLHEDAD